MTAPRRRTRYARVLRLRHLDLRGWQAALLLEGSLGVGVVLALADLAPAWTPLLLPAVVGAVVKGHDLLTGELDRDQDQDRPD